MYRLKVLSYALLLTVTYHYKVFTVKETNNAIRAQEWVNFKLEWIQCVVFYISCHIIMVFAAPESILPLMVSSTPSYSWTHFTRLWCEK